MALLGLLTLCFSCNNDDLEIDAPTSESASSTNGIKYITGNNTTKPGEQARTTIVNGMLEFDDIATFLNTLDMLEQQADAYDDNFLAQWKHLNESEIDDKEDQLGFNPDQPYINFERSYPGFTSLRKVIANQVTTWLSHSSLDDKNDPEDHFIIDDELRAVLNVNAQVKIGKSLFQMTRFGYVEITDGNFNTLDLVASTDASLVNLPTVLIGGGYYGSTSGNNNTPNPPSGCRTDIDDEHYYYPANNRRIKAQQKMKGYSGIWGSKIKAKTHHYKKKNGKWKKRRGLITAEISYESVNQYCNLPNNEHEVTTKRRRKVKAKIVAPASANHTYKTKYRKLKTIHKRENVAYSDFFYE